MLAVWWDVYLHGRKIDSVPFDAGIDEWYVLRSLVGHDGYDPAIQVKRRGRV